MKFTKLAITLLCSAVLLCGCAKNSDVVLKVNDMEVTRGEFYGDFEKLKKSQLREMEQATPEEKNFIALSLKDRFLSDVIVRTLLKSEFEKRKIEATEDEIKAKQEEIAKRLGSEENLKKVLKQNGISKARLHDDLASEVKIDKLAIQLSPNAVSDKDVQAFYNQNKDQFYTDATVHAYHILIGTNPEEIKRKIVDEDKEGKLSNDAIESKVKEEVSKQEALVKEIFEKASKNPKDFEKLAKEYSQDPGSKEKGGDLGYVQKRDLVKEFSDVAFGQKIGSVARAKSPFGEHIIYVTDKKPAGVKQFDEVKEELKAFLTQEIKANNLRNLIGELQKNAKIEYIEEELKPENFQKQMEEAQKKFIEAQQKKVVPESKMKVLNKTDKADKKEKAKEEPKK